MDILCTEGVILQVIPFRNEDQILTLFTPDRGVLKLFCKKHSRQGQRYMPLTRAEVSYREKRSEIFACEDISIVDSYLTLRQTLTMLQAACDLLKVINTSQLLGKEAPQLYKLLLFFLDKLPLSKDPNLIVAAFKLKVLKSEGLFNIEEDGLGCFDVDEVAFLWFLAENRAYEPLATILLPEGMKEKIDLFFATRIGE